MWSWPFSFGLYDSNIGYRGMVDIFRQPHGSGGTFLSVMFLSFLHLCGGYVNLSILARANQIEEQQRDLLRQFSTKQSYIGTQKGLMKALLIQLDFSFSSIFLFSVSSIFLLFSPFSFYFMVVNIEDWSISHASFVGFLDNHAALEVCMHTLGSFKKSVASGLCTPKNPNSFHMAFEFFCTLWIFSYAWPIVSP